MTSSWKQGNNIQLNEGRSQKLQVDSQMGLPRVATPLPRRCFFRAGHKVILSLRWRHSGRDSVSNHQPRYCFLNRLFRHRSKKTSKLRVTGLCAGNSPGTGEFPAQMASSAENVSIWWRHHDTSIRCHMIRQTQDVSYLLFCSSGKVDVAVKSVKPRTVRWGSNWNEVT